MPPVIDSHVHLWPASAADHKGHAWMEAVPSLAKQQVLKDYRKVVQESQPTSGTVPKIVYIETDRRYEYDAGVPLETWAAGPLEEVRFLKSIIEGDSEDADLLAGIILWAPVDRGLAVFDEWLGLAERTAGPTMWKKVKGFRYLLQAITERSYFEQIVLSEDFSQIMSSMGEKGFVFDVGIDQHRGGIWQLEIWEELLNRLSEEANASSPTFILNHLCKPDIVAGSVEAGEQGFKAWQNFVRNFAKHPDVYMKLSGAFSELSNGRVETSDVDILTDRIRPWTDTVFDAFGSSRILFGSDWPVCNIHGPAVEQSWGVWYSIAEKLCAQQHLSQAEMNMIFGGTAENAYRLAVEQ